MRSKPRGNLGAFFLLLRPRALGVDLMPGNFTYGFACLSAGIDH